MVSVCTGLLGEEACLSTLVDTRLNRIPLPFTFSDSLMYVTLYITVLPWEKEVVGGVFTLFILLLLFKLISDETISNTQYSC